MLNSPCPSLKPKESENSVLSFQMELCCYVWREEKKKALISPLEKDELKLNYSIGQRTF